VAGEPDVTRPHGLTDVPDGARYEDAVAWLKFTEIISGYGRSDIYAPNVAVNRGQVAAFRSRLLSTPQAWDASVTLSSTMVPGWSPSAIRDRRRLLGGR
jgi:hypothetical protein